MLRGLISAAGIASLLAALVIAPTSSLAQYDLDTCSGRLNYCVEWARRSGQPTTQCELSYQECQRDGGGAGETVPQQSLRRPSRSRKPLQSLLGHSGSTRFEQSLQRSPRTTILHRPRQLLSASLRSEGC